MREQLRRIREHRLTRIAVIALVALGFLAILGYVLLIGYFTVGEDMMIDLRANQTSFHITNAEQASVEVNLSTAGQLFCHTTCELALLNVSSDKEVYRNSYSTSSGETHTERFSLLPGTKGEGQNVYSVSASCRNTRALLCPTRGPERRKTLLLSVNYGLAAEEAQARPRLKQQIEGMLGLLRETDLALQWSAKFIAANPRVRAQPLLAKSSSVQDRFTDEQLLLEDAKLLWRQESYLVLDGLLKTSDVTERSMRQTRDDALQLKAELAAMPESHNLLLADIESARADLGKLLAAHAPVPPGIADPLILDTNSLVRQYAEDNFQYASARQRASGLRGRINATASSLQARNAGLLLAGKALLASHAPACAACEKDAGNLTGVCAAAERNLLLLDAIASNTTSPPANHSGNTTDVSANESGNASASVLIPFNITTMIAHTQRFLNDSCEATNATIDPRQLLPLEATRPNVTSAIETSIADSAPRCCVFGVCQDCCNTAMCSDDPSLYPVVFVHGHSFNGLNSPEYSLGGYFSDIQTHLQEDGYLDAGVVTPSSVLSEVGPGEWGLSGRPITVRVTYYYNFYKSGSEYTVITQKSESLETYAIRLKELLDIVKHHTGKKKVNIVAHSMGGLVVRRYIQMFGEDSVDTVILIATPNHGVSARSKTLCPVFGEGKECTDMAADSVFLRKLNDPEGWPKDVRIVTITGLGCEIGGEDGDGVVAADSSRLPNATNYDVNGTCPDFFGTDLHTEILNIQEYPDVYEIIRDELRK